MTNASRAKRKRAAVRSAKRSRQNTWWYGLTALVVIAGVALIVYARATAPTPVGPYLQDASGTKKDTHWHAALGVYDCDKWMGDSAGSGVWNWPLATPSGSPARSEQPSVYAGMHSHNDGVIHMEPLVSAETGRNTTVGLYFDYGGWDISSTGYSFLGATRTNGDKCGTKPGTLQWAVGKADTTTGKVTAKYVVQTGNPAKHKLNEGDIVIVGFLPEGKSILGIGDPPSVPNLAKALDVENTQPGAPMPTVPGTGATTPVTVAPESTTPTTAAATPTTSAATPTP